MFSGGTQRRALPYYQSEEMNILINNYFFCKVRIESTAIAFRFTCLSLRNDSLSINDIFFDITNVLVQFYDIYMIYLWLALYTLISYHARSTHAIQFMPSFFFCKNRTFACLKSILKQCIYFVVEIFVYIM